MKDDELSESEDNMDKNLKCTTRNTNVTSEEMPFIELFRKRRVVFFKVT